jgi:hypothetical protein
MLAKPLHEIADHDVFREFKEMRIKHPCHEDAIAVFEKLRMRKVVAPDAEQTATCLFAGSSSGKSTTVRWYIETIVVNECLRLGLLKDTTLKRSVLARIQSMALHVELSGSTSFGGLMSDFLIALGDPDPYGGSPKSRRFRVEKLLTTRNYQIIFLDETQHIKRQGATGPRTQQDDATELQNTLKNWVKRWPIIFVGTQHAESVVFEHQVLTRSEEPITFGPFHPSRGEDMKIFADFCGRLALKIAQHGILPEPPKLLVEGDVPLCLNISSKGRLGMLTLIVRNAIVLLLLNGGATLTIDHLAAAVKALPLRIKLCSYNPFIDGPVHIPSLKEYSLDEAEGFAHA